MSGSTSGARGVSQPMRLTLARPFTWPWRAIGIASYVIVNVALITYAVRLGPDIVQDWWLWVAATAAENPYRTATPLQFVWSPVMVPVMAAVVAAGYWPWLVAHVAAVLLLRSPLLIALVLVSYGFWFDAAQGNTLTFSLVAGSLALRGSRPAALVYLALFLLMPRPLEAPLALWLLWRDRSLWGPFSAVFVAHGAAVVGSGMAREWIDAMLSFRGPGFTMGPTLWMGFTWLIAGIPLAAWLTWKGHVGWAGMAMSPYVLPQYLIWPLVEVRDGRRP